jgi:hypothetical protein
MVLGNGHHNMSLADEVMESINEAIEYYKEKDYVEAKSSLEYAAQLIGQMRSEGLQAFLPEPLSGWKADEAISQNIGPAMFGGMTGASRNYRKDNGHIKIEIMGDSQMMQGVMAMMANPAYATADGGKLKKIKRQKAVIKYSPSNSNGEITLVVGQKYIVKLEGRQIKEQDLIDYASAIDYKGLKQF